MKKRLLNILLISMMGLALTACNKKEAIIVDVGDTRNDSSQNEQVVGSADAVDIANKDNPTVVKDVVVSSEDKAVVIDKLDDIKGLWVASDSLLEITSDKDISGSIAGIVNYFTSTYETDHKSKLVITIVDRTTSSNVLEDGTIEIVEELTENKIDAAIKEIKQSPDGGYTHMILTINGVDKKFIRDNYYEPPKVAEEETSENTVNESTSTVLTPEEQTELNAWALESGIDPETGLPLAEVPVEDVIVTE